MRKRHFLYLFFIIAPLQAMKRPCGEAFSAPKRNKRTEFTLISSDGGTISIPKPLARFSPTLARTLITSSPHPSISLPVDLASTNIIVQALRDLEHITTQRIAFDTREAYTIMLFHLELLLNELPTPSLLALVNLASNLGIPLLPRLIKEYLTDQHVIINGPPATLLKDITSPALKAHQGNITLESGDGQQLTIARTTAILSSSIWHSIEDTQGEHLVPLPNITGEALTLTVKSLNALASITNTQDYPQAVANVLNPLFIGISYDDAITMLTAVNYLNIPILTTYITALIINELLTNTTIKAIAHFTQKLSKLHKDLCSIIINALERQTDGILLLLTPLNILKSPTTWVTSAAFSPDGKFALTGSFDKIARYWDLESGKIIKKLIMSTIGQWSTSVAISPDGKYALTDSTEHRLEAIMRYWDLETDITIKILKGHTDWVRSGAISPDGKYALTGSEDTTARYWNLETGQTIKILQGHTSTVTSVAISPDGKYALTGSKDKTARYWNLSTGETITILKGHTWNITSVAISPNGKYALTGPGYPDKTARYWDLKTGQTIKVLEGDTGGVTSVAISPDGKYALTGSTDYTARYWNLETGQTVRILKGHTAWVTAVAISPNGKCALTGSHDGTACYWGVQESNKPTIPLLVLLARLAQPGARDTILQNKYFNDLLNNRLSDLRLKLDPEIQKLIKEYFKIQ